MSLSCDDLIKEGSCHADCCGVFPTRVGFVSKFWQDYQVSVHKILQLPNGLELALNIKDDKCVFLNRQSSRCEIYDNRPEVCRDFGNAPEPLLTCPWITIEGERKTRAQRRNVYRGYNKARKHGSCDLYKGGIKI